MSSAAVAPTAVSRPAINPWIVAVAVVVPTFMEVLDTTIANVALRYIAGGLSRGQRRQRVGAHELPGRQCHHPADLGLALGPPGAPQLLPALDRGLHHRLGIVRNGDEPRATDPLPGDPGAGRRRSSAVEPGSSPRQLSAREAGRGHDDVRHRRPARAGRRPDARRLSHRQLQLALDLLHQHSGRRARVSWRLTSWSRTRNT